MVNCTLVCPAPLFDDLKCIDGNDRSLFIKNAQYLCDYQYALKFLKSYKGSQGTFNSYRSEIERFLHWAWVIAKKSLKKITRDDIELYVSFCQNPPLQWIGIKKASRFVEKDGMRTPNPEWRPFVATISKIDRKNNKKVNPKKFNLSQGVIKKLFAILSSFFNYLSQEEYLFANPVALVRQKSKFIRKFQSKPKVRRLSELQWHYVIKTAKKLAKESPELHNRTIFILSAMYLMYLRISELAASARWIPMMNHFSRDHNGAWWFTTVGKGNKERQIAVCDQMLEALKEWRKHLKLSPSLPSSSDKSPLLPNAKITQKNIRPIASTTYIRTLIQQCFDRAGIELARDGHSEDAESLAEATVHWLRHTGISEDVKTRPREHVRDDAGHSSSATTDKYIDVELKERHHSAKDKKI